MSYTDYSLLISSLDGSELTQESGRSVIKRLFEINPIAKQGLDEDGQGKNSVKWSESEADLKALSLEYPHLLFILYSEGEDHEDLWKKYFCNGKMQSERAKITFREFNPEELA